MYMYIILCTVCSYYGAIGTTLCYMYIYMYIRQLVDSLCIA